MAKNWKKFLPADPFSNEEDTSQTPILPGSDFVLDETIRDLMKEREELEQTLQGIKNQAKEPANGRSFDQEIPSIHEKRKMEKFWEAKNKAALNKLKSRKGENALSESTWEEKRKASLEKLKELNKGNLLQSKTGEKKKSSDVWLSKRIQWLENLKNTRKENDKWASRREKAIEAFKSARQEAKKLESFREQLDKFQQDATALDTGGNGLGEFASDSKFTDNPVTKKYDEIQAKIKDKLSGKQKYLDIVQPFLKADDQTSFLERIDAARKSALGKKIEEKVKEKIEEKKKQMAKKKKAERQKLRDRLNNRKKRKKDQQDDEWGLRKRDRRKLKKFDDAESSSDDFLSKRQKRREKKGKNDPNNLADLPDLDDRNEESKKEKSRKEKAQQRKEERLAKKQEKEQAEKQAEQDREEKKRKSIFNRRSEEKEEQKRTEREQKRAEEKRQLRAEERRKNRREDELRFDRFN